MWKYTINLDEDKDVGTVTAQLFNDKDEIVTTYSDRVTLYDIDAIRDFIRKTRQKVEVKDERTTKMTELLDKIVAEEETVDTAIAAEKQAIEDAKNNPVENIINPI